MRLSLWLWKPWLCIAESPFVINLTWGPRSRVLPPEMLSLKKPLKVREHLRNTPLAPPPRAVLRWPLGRNSHELACRDIPS